MPASIHGQIDFYADHFLKGKVCVGCLQNTLHKIMTQYLKNLYCITLEVVIPCMYIRTYVATVSYRNLSNDVRLLS